jgi:branched-chain amino acid aminotransferase
MATLAESEMTFAHLPHPAPLAADARAAVLADPGFGKVFSDHMVSIDWDEERGWHNAAVIPYGPIPLDPAAAVLHYAQEIFEGLKAYRLADGGIALFRPEANAARFNASARRLAMPELPEALFVQAVKEMVLADRDWFPTVEAARCTCARSCSHRKPSSACARRSSTSSW